MPGLIMMPVLYIIYIALCTIPFLGTYFVCELIWPKKELIKDGV